MQETGYVWERLNEAVYAGRTTVEKHLKREKTIGKEGNKESSA